MTTVLKNTAPLEPKYLSRTIVDRGDEQETLNALYADRSDADLMNVFVHGPRGTGKTHVTHHVLDDLPDHVTMCYVPCTRWDTQYKVLKQLCHHVTDNPIENGYHTSQLQHRFEQHVGHTRSVIVLDDVDFLLMNDGDSLLYYLSRIDHGDNIGIIAISANHQDLASQLEERTYSSLYPQRIGFEPYTAEQVYQILVERAKKSLAKQSLHRNALTYLHQRENPGVQAGGDLRTLRWIDSAWHRTAHRPRRHARPHAGTIGQYRDSPSESRRYPCGGGRGYRRKTPKIPPSQQGRTLIPLPDRSNGGVALPALRRCVNPRFPTHPRFCWAGGGKPRRLRRGGCHITSTTQNVSLGLTWLKTAAEAADTVITEQLVKEHREQAVQTYADHQLTDFSDHHRLLYQAIQELTTETDSTIHTGSVYHRYQELCRTYSEDALSDRRISDFLKHLELLNLIKAEYHYGGREGKTREIRLQEI